MVEVINMILLIATTILISSFAILVIFLFGLFIWDEIKGRR